MAVWRRDCWIRCKFSVESCSKCRRCVFSPVLEAAIQKVDTGEGVVIFCDLLFGSPCNCSARLLQDAKYADKISVITGMNLCMVLEYIGSGAAGMDREALVDTGHKGIVDFNKLLRERQAA